MKKKTLLALSILYVASSLPALANQVNPLSIDVYLTQEMSGKVIDTKNYTAITHIKYVDAFDQSKNALNAAMPAFNPQKESVEEYKLKTKKMALNWLSEHKSQILEGSNTLNFVFSHNISQFPAIVIDDNSVQYGVSLSEAVKNWQQTVGNSGGR